MSQETIKSTIQSNEKNNPKISNQFFSKDAYKCNSFLSGLKKCNSNEDIINFVDSIVNGFPLDENVKQIGAPSGLFVQSPYLNDGKYSGFIHPSIKILNATAGFGYRIYDRDYLYAFAYGLRKLDLPEETNILPYVMKYLNSYFGFPKDKIDRREDVLYNFAVAYAEDFYKKYNIPVDKAMGAIDQMQILGDFPLSALKGTYSAQCVERSALAHNIMKLCGYNSSIMYGDCASFGTIESHCWNSICDKFGNILIIDFSNTVYSYKNGQFFKREPYACAISGDDYLMQDGLLEFPDYHYENGKRVRDSKNRKYAVGKTINLQEDVTNGNKLI